jgi:hypothetical protein
MARRLVSDIEAERKAEQVSLFDTPTPTIHPASTRVEASSLDRLTWKDHVDFGDSQTPGSKLPRWKLGLKMGTELTLTPKHANSIPVVARVLFDMTHPPDPNNPVMVQVGIFMHGNRVCITTIPVTAIAAVQGSDNA